MPTHTGSGFSHRPDSYQAGLEATTRALAAAGQATCDLAILLATSRHDPHQFAAGVRAALGPLPRLLGTYAVGVITNDDLGYDGYQGGVAVLASDTVQAHLFLQPELAGREHACGHALAEALPPTADPADANLLFFYDIINRASGRLQLNQGTTLVTGMSAGFGAGGWPVAAGAGIMGDMQFRLAHQWFDDQVLAGAAVGLTLRGARLHTTTLHGCRPASAYHTVTKADGSVILEIDNRPATDVVAHIIGADSGMSFEDYGWFITFGVNRSGDQWGEYHAETYTNRMCVGVDRKRQGLVMVEPDLVEGSEIQLMSRSFDFEYIHAETERLLADVAAQGRRPFLAFYIDCAGRAGAYSGNDQEDAAEVQRALGRIPLLGLYAGSEIGQLSTGAIAQFNWTGVLNIWSEPLD